MAALLVTNSNHAIAIFIIGIIMNEEIKTVATIFVVAIELSVIILPIFFMSLQNR